MLKIKLIRFGKKNQPHYRIVVQEARTKRDGKYTAKLGHYAPAQEPKILEINLEEYKKWLGKGAQPTDTVAGLVKRFESGTPFPPKKKKASKKQLAKAKAEKKAKETASEKPAVEKKAEAPKKETTEPTDVKNEKAPVEEKKEEMKPTEVKKETPVKKTVEEKKEKTK